MIRDGKHDPDGPVSLQEPRRLPRCSHSRPELRCGNEGERSTCSPSRRLHMDRCSSDSAAGGEFMSFLPLADVSDLAGLILCSEEGRNPTMTVDVEMRPGGVRGERWRSVLSTETRYSVETDTKVQTKLSKTD